MTISRRLFFAAAGMAGLSIPLAARPGLAQSNLVSASGIDQTAQVQAALDRAAQSSGRVDLPAGRIMVSGLRIPSGTMLVGIPGASELVQAGDGPLLEVAERADVTIRNIVLDGMGRDGDIWHGGLVHITGSQGVTIEGVAVRNTQLNGISALDSAVRIVNCDVAGSELTGIFIYNGGSTYIAGNRILECGNGGIRIWRGENAFDGAIVTGNRIAAIDWTNGGNGQNGNGVNIFRADGVIVSDNVITDCAFSAIRLNTTNNTQVRGNTCMGSGEVAIFSEFTFSGSVISGNIIDGAAAGISMTNYNDGGRVATCTGNIVRNITSSSPVNPDTSPYGIAAEADAVVTGNLVENNPGIGYLAGWGPYLRDVLINGNLARDCGIGISVSVADGAGSAIITDNVISDFHKHAITADRWWETVSTDLAVDVDRFPNLTVRNNSIIPG